MELELPFDFYLENIPIDEETEIEALLQELSEKENEGMDEIYTYFSKVKDSLKAIMTL